MKVLGIDPGANGAIALVEGHSVVLHEMPNLSIRRGRSDKAEIDGYALWRLLSEVSCDVAYLEQVGGMEGQSPSAAFNFGRAAGAPEYMLMAAGIRHVRVPPIVWKRGLKLHGGKDDMRLAAMRLWPREAEVFRKRRIDFSEAALIAEYGRKQEGENSVFD